MTYCLGLCLNDGVVFASDSRTNAGVDYVTSYSKMHVFQPSPDRLFVILSAGNLATTQEVMNHIQRDIDHPANTVGTTLSNANYLFEAAEYVGRVSVNVQQSHLQSLSSTGVSGETTLLIGGQIRGQRHGLMLIYPQGNYITASLETPYLQIGESKYGKPALDRIVNMNMSLEEGAKLCLVSLDATTRSNITVGPPFEIGLYRRDSMMLEQRCKFEASDPFLVYTRKIWNDGIRNAFMQLPSLDFKSVQGSSNTNTNVTSQTVVAQSDANQQQPIMQQQQNLFTTA